MRESTNFSFERIYQKFVSIVYSVAVVLGPLVEEPLQTVNNSLLKIHNAHAYVKSSETSHKLVYPEFLKFLGQ